MDDTNSPHQERDWWKQGKALDLWSIPHFLFGVLMAFVPTLIGFSLLTALALTIILALVWEMYEKFVDIKETVLNSTFDVILPILAFTLTSWLLQLYPMHYHDQVVVCIAVGIIYAYTNISGWLAYRRRHKDFI